MIRQRDIYVILGVVAVLIVAGVLVSVARQSSGPAHLDRDAFLQAAWRDYKQHIWDGQTGRTIDSQAGGVTTSEGQSYTMLRSVWENDRPVFDKAWQWTAANLQRPDKLFSWRYGTRPDGTNGVLTGQGGQNTASDADSDIALALIMAGRRWQEPKYTAAAKVIIPAIWQQEVVTVNGTPYLTADDQERHNESSVLINPSYLAPYAYKVFARLDPAHDWNGVASSSYELIRSAGQNKLDANGSVGLPPNWVRLSRSNGHLEPPAATGLATDFGFDAFRTVWRVALDWQWNHDPRAASTLKTFGFLNEQWRDNHKLVAIYSHAGEPKAGYESIALYGGTLPYFQVQQPQTASLIIDSKFLSLYDDRTHTLKQPLGYNDNSWAWFGVAFAEVKLTDFTKGVF